MVLARKGLKKHKRKRKATISFSDLNPGDFVVHENHGIGQYKGIEQIDIQGIKKRLSHH